MSGTGGALERYGCALFGALVIASIAAVPMVVSRPSLGVPLALVAAVGWAFVVVRVAVASHREREAREAVLARLRSIAAPEGTAWRALLEGEGLGDTITHVAPHVRPALRLATRERGRAGGSRVGGSPELPADLAWPTHAGARLPFVAQIDLAEARSALPDGPLPPDGHLWLFAAAADPTCVVAVIHRESASLVPREGDDDVEPCHVALEAYDDLPDRHDLEALRLALGERADRYEDVRVYLDHGTTGSAGKLLGHPRPLHGSMAPELERVAPGVPWSLLCAIEGDDRFGWGDLATLYLWIRDDDLASRRFDRVHGWIDFS